MGTVINRISITNASISKTDTTHCQVEAQWEVAKSAGTYSGSYFIWIILDGKTYAEQEIPNPGVGDTDTYGTITFQVDENDTKSYYLQIVDATKTVKSEMKLLIIQTYTGVSCIYDGGEINIKWDKTIGNVSAGICTLTSLEDIVVSKDILTNTRHLVFEQDIENYDSNNIWSIVLNPTMNNGIVMGPDSALMNIYTQEPTISELSLKQGSLQNGKAVLLVNFTQPYTASDIKVLCSLFKKEIELTEYTLVNPLPTSSNNSYTIEYTVPEEAVNPFHMKEYQLRLNLCTDNTKSMQESSENVRCLLDTQIFKRGYYPVSNNGIVTGVAYRFQSEQESTLQISLMQELFQTPITEAIDCQSLKLEKQDVGYMLTIQTQNPLPKTDYNSFCSTLTDKMVTIKGLYLLQDTIARSGNLLLTDLLYYHSGVDSSNRCSDLRPGFTLEVETANYMPTYEIDKQDGAPGFVGTHTAHYKILTREADTDIRLEFNSFIDQYAEYFDVAKEQDSNVITAGNVLDFFVSDYRKPLYRIVYPQGFQASDVEQTHYPSDNILLIGADSYSQLGDYTESIKNMPVFSENSNIPVLMFRGRSAVTLMVSIWVNGDAKLVPVGTTLGGVLEEQGFYQAEMAKTKVERLSPYGYAQMSASSCVTALPLMLGDRIEVS